MGSRNDRALMAKIYTRAGDAGETALFGGSRVRKDNGRIEAIGEVDELCAAIGVARMELLRGGTSPPGLDELLAGVQHRLFDFGAELATPDARLEGNDVVQADEIVALEVEIDRYEATLAPLRAFILPGGSPLAAQLHVARCVCRRAERRLVALSASASLRPQLLGFLNRLSDLLFVLARAANQANGQADVIWQQRRAREAASGRPGTS